jgi:hypothetical protein
LLEDKPDISGSEADETTAPQLVETLTEDGNFARGGVKQSGDDGNQSGFAAA